MNYKSSGIVWGALLSLIGMAGCTAQSTSPGEGAGTGPVRSSKARLEGEEERPGHGLPPVRPGKFPAGQGAPQQPGTGAGSGTWTPAQNIPAELAAGFSILLTDGSVMVQDLNTGGNGWWKLTPDAMGSYVKGTWT